ncbi:hypothetical protein C1Y40_03108 [Mycobacterium talmoniae]|uniref:Uncharacterized protein n=1 Tax=Mycobacterium talmoniae TaxID=1858794 RepID=A0A2S8BJ67_9MYCO|nr:hypothetical protein C1Y40_03108 [Mycobacterium talmoniae]
MSGLPDLPRYGLIGNGNPLKFSSRSPGPRYCSHSLAVSGAVTFSTPPTIPQIKFTGLDMFTNPIDPIGVPLVGLSMFSVLEMAFGVMCRMLRSASLESASVWVTLANRPTASVVSARLPATNRCTSPIDVDRSVSAASKLDRLSSTTLVSVASRSSNTTICWLLSRRAVTKVCRPSMMSTILPLPSAKIRATPDNWASVSRSLVPLPAMAPAALSMNRAAEVPDTVPCSPNSVASRFNWVLTSSHSTGTAVRSRGITAPSDRVGPSPL